MDRREPNNHCYFGAIYLKGINRKKCFTIVYLASVLSVLPQITLLIIKADSSHKDDKSD